MTTPVSAAFSSSFSVLRCVVSVSSTLVRRFDSARRQVSWSSLMLFARGPRPMMPLRCPFSSRSNSVCQKLSSSVIFLAAMLFVSRSLSTVSSLAAMGLTTSAMRLSNSALTRFSSSVSGGWALGSARVSKNLAVKVSFHRSRWAAISASRIVTLDSTFCFSASAVERAVSISPCRSFSMTELTVSRKSKSASGCEMVSPISVATTIRSEN